MKTELTQALEQSVIALDQAETLAAYTQNDLEFRLELTSIKVQLYSLMLRAEALAPLT